MASRPVDERIVKMTLENEDFERNAAKSLKTCTELENATGNLAGIDLSKLENSVGAIANRFSFLGNLVQEFYQKHARQLIDMAENMVKSLSINNVSAGWSKYEDYVNSVQTIMSAIEGITMDEVNAQMEKLLWFTDETSYKFTDMVSNIGKFTANGVGLEDAVSAMQGIANWAALSGANANAASSAMYNLSQAMAVGALKMQDWKSIQNVNMGTQKFKKTAIEAAVALGTLEKAGEGVWKTTNKVNASVKAGQEVTLQTFDSTLQAAWLSKDVMMDVFNQFGKFSSVLQSYSDQTGKTATDLLQAVDMYKENADSLNEAAKILGLTAEDAKPILDELSKSEYELGLQSFKAAQEAKTFTDAIDSVKDAASTGFMNIFTKLIGDYEQAKKLWTTVANELYDVFVEPINALNDLIDLTLGGWGDFEQILKDSSVDVEKFQNKFKMVAKDYGYDVDKLIEDTGSFEDALKQIPNSAQIVNKVFDQYNEITSETIEKTEDMTGKLEYFQDVVNRVWNGDFKNGEERIKALTDAGYDYAQVQSLVNKVQYEANKGYALTIEDITTLTDVELKAIGYTEDEVEAIRKIAEEARTAGSDLNFLIRNMSRMNIRDMGIAAVANVFNNIRDVLGAVHTAWVNTFGGVTADNLYNAVKAVYDVTEALRLSESQIDKLTNGLEGVFSVLDLIADFISTGVSTAFDLLKDLIHSTNLDIFDMISGFGDLLKAMTGWVKENEYINKFYKTLEKAIKRIIDVLKDYFKVWEDAGGKTKLLEIWNNLFEFFSNVMKGLGRLLQPVIDGLGKLFNKIVPQGNSEMKASNNLLVMFTEFLLNISKYLKNINFEPFYKGIDNFLGMLAAFFGGKKGSLKEGSEEIQNALGGEVTGSVEVLADSMEKVTSLNYSGLTGAFESMRTNLAPIAKTVTDLPSTVETLSDKFGKITKTFGDWVSEYGLTFIGVPAVLGLVTWAMTGLITKGKELYDFITNLKSASADLLNILHNPSDVLFGGMIKSINNLTKSVNLLAIVMLLNAIGNLAQGLKVLSEIDNKGLARAVTMMGAVTAVLIAVSKFVDSNKILDVSKAIAIMAGSIILLVIGTKMLDKVGTDSLVRLISILAALLVIAAGVSRFTGDNGLAGISSSVLMLAGAMVVMAFAGKLLGNTDWTSIVAIMAGTIAMAYTLQAVNAWALAKTAAALIVLGLAIDVIAAGIAAIALTGADSDKIFKIAEALGVIIVALALFTKLSNSKSIMASAMMMASIGYAIGNIGFAIVEIAKIAAMDQKALWTAVGTMAGIMIFVGILAVLYKRTSKEFPTADMLGFLGLFAGVSLLIKVLTSCMLQLAKVPTEALQQTRKTVFVMLIVVAGLVAELALLGPKMETSLVSAEMMALVIASFAASLWVLSKTDPTNALINAAALSLVLLTFAMMAAFMNGAKLNLTGFAELAAAILILSGALFVISNIKIKDFNSFVLVMTALVTILIFLTAAIAGLAVVHAEAVITSIGLAFYMALQPIATIVKYISLLVLGLTALALVFNAFDLSFDGEKVSRRINAFIDQIIVVIKNISPKVVEALIVALIEITNALASKILEYSDQIKDALILAVEALVVLILEVIFPVIWAAIDSILSKLFGQGWEQVKKFFSDAWNKFEKMIKDIDWGAVLYTAGVMIVGGLGIGLIAGAVGLPGILVGIIVAAIAAFLAYLGIHSPSKLFEGYGENIIEGLVNGIGNLIDSVVDAVIGVAKAIINTFLGWVDPIVDTAKKWYNGIKNTFSKGWDTITDTVSGWGRDLAGVLGLSFSKSDNTITKATQHVTDTMSKTLNEQKVPVEKSATEVSDSVNNGLSKISPDKPNKAINDTVSGMISFMGMKEPDMEKAGSDLGLSATGGTKKELNFDIGKALGDMYAAGLLKSFNDEENKSKIYVAAANLSKQGTIAVRDVYRVRSPSRVAMELGDYFGQGLAIGITNTEDEVYDSSVSLAQVALDGVANATEQIQNALDSNLNYTPLITPEIDLTNLQRISDYTSGMSVQVDSLSAKYGMRNEEPGTVIIEGITVNVPVTAKPGMNPAEIAKIARTEMEQALRTEVRKIKWS